MKHLTRAVLTLCAVPTIAAAYIEQGIYLERIIQRHTHENSLWGIIAWEWPALLGLPIVLYSWLRGAYERDLKEQG